jgi:hypothetical protein
MSAAQIMNMGITSTARGHKIVFDLIGKEWKYADTLEPVDDSRPCPRCGEYPTPEGYDACLGHIPGAISACCGHGIKRPILMINKDNAVDLIRKEFRCEIVVDDSLPAFGAHWIPEDPDADDCDIIAINLGSCLICSMVEPDVSFKELVVETLMHEFGHCVERWVGLELSEERVEALVAAYHQKFSGVKNQ